MENTLSKKWSSIAKDAFKASKELEDMNTKTLDKVTENQINLSNAFFEANNNFFENLLGCKKYPDLLANHNKLLTTYSEVFSKAATNAEELMTGVKNDYGDWIERGIEKSTSNELFNIFMPAKETTSKRNGHEKDIK